MIAVTCPPRERLTDFVQGRLALALHEAVETHLDECSDCRALVERLDGTTSALAALVTPSPDATLDDPALRRLVVQVKALVPGSPSPEATAPLVGSVLGNYELLELVGSGGMGRVYRARHRRMNRLVALKVLAPEMLRSAEARARFQREVEAAARVASPHVVAAYDAGEADGRAFLVMEFVEGENLADLVKRVGPVPVPEALSYVSQAARGLAHAHAAGLVHRDVKPANLLLDLGGMVKVLDLGLARARIEVGAGEALTRTSAAMGTPAFLAPEQAADSRAADVRADVYGLGCTLYYLLSGRPPFEGATALEVVLAHREKPLPSIPNVPAPIMAFLRTALAKRPQDRFPTMNAAVAALERLLDRRPAVRSNRPHWRWGAAAVVLLSAAALSWAFIAFGARPIIPNDVAVLPDVRPPRNTEAELEEERRAERRQQREARLQHAATEAGKRTLSLVQFVTALNRVDAERRAQRQQRVESLVRHSASAVRRARSLVNFVAARSLRTPALALKPIKPGTFVVEADKAPDGKKPRRTIEITRPFEMGEFEVTQGQFEAVMGTNPSFFRSQTLKGKDTSRHPVDSVSWLDAIRFCNRLSARHGLKPYYRIEGEVVTRLGGTGFRLPTEAEWEYACRAGTETRWFFGDDESKLGEFAWFSGNSQKQTHAVGGKQPNPWGLHDMLGNVPEWCWDRFQPDGLWNAREWDPSGPGEGEARVFRGGGWSERAEQTRSAARQPLRGVYVVEHTPNHPIGFRVARDVE